MMDIPSPLFATPSPAAQLDQYRIYIRCGTFRGGGRGGAVHLRRLRVERIDLYQMHRPAEDGMPLEDYWQTLLDLKKAGKVGAVGLSNHTIEQLKSAEAPRHAASLQPPFSATKAMAAPAELPWCKDQETGVIVYSPMQSGFLSLSFSAQRAASLPTNDRRLRNTDLKGETPKHNLRVAEAMGTVAEQHGTTVAAVAVAWTLALPGVTAAIVGAHKPEQVDGWSDPDKPSRQSTDLQGRVLTVEAGAVIVLPSGTAIANLARATTSLSPVPIRPIRSGTSAAKHRRNAQAGAWTICPSRHPARCRGTVVHCRNHGEEHEPDISFSVAAGEGDQRSIRPGTYRQSGCVRRRNRANTRLLAPGRDRRGGWRLIEIVGWAVHGGTGRAYGHSPSRRAADDRLRLVWRLRNSLGCKRRIRRLCQSRRLHPCACLPAAYGNQSVTV
jgi:hypothetical protein